MISRLLSIFFFVILPLVILGVIIYFIYIKFFAKNNEKFETVDTVENNKNIIKSILNANITLSPQETNYNETVFKPMVTGIINTYNTLPTNIYFPFVKDIYDANDLFKNVIKLMPKGSALNVNWLSLIDLDWLLSENGINKINQTTLPSGFYIYINEEVLLTEYPSVNNDLFMISTSTTNPTDKNGNYINTKIWKLVTDAYLNTTKKTLFTGLSEFQLNSQTDASGSMVTTLTYRDILKQRMTLNVQYANNSSSFYEQILFIQKCYTTLFYNYVNGCSQFIQNALSDGIPKFIQNNNYQTYDINIQINPSASNDFNVILKLLNIINNICYNFSKTNFSIIINLPRTLSYDDMLKYITFIYLFKYGNADIIKSTLNIDFTKTNTFLNTLKYAQYISGFNIFSDISSLANNTISYYSVIWLGKVQSLQQTWENNIDNKLSYYFGAGNNGYNYIINNDNIIDAFMLDSKRIYNSQNIISYPYIKNKILNEPLPSCCGSASGSNSGNICDCENSSNLNMNINNIPTSNTCIEISPIYDQMFGYYPNIGNNIGKNLYYQGIPIVLSTSNFSYILGYNDISYDYWASVISWNLDLLGLKTLVYNSVLYSSFSGSNETLSNSNLNGIISNLDNQWCNWFNSLTGASVMSCTPASLTEIQVSVPRYSLSNYKQLNDSNGSGSGSGSVSDNLLNDFENQKQIILSENYSLSNMSSTIIYPKEYDISNDITMFVGNYTPSTDNTVAIQNIVIENSMFSAIPEDSFLFQNLDMMPKGSLNGLHYTSLVDLEWLFGEKPSLTFDGSGSGSGSGSGNVKGSGLSQKWGDNKFFINTTILTSDNVYNDSLSLFYFGNAPPNDSSGSTSGSVWTDLTTKDYISNIKNLIYPSMTLGGINLLSKNDPINYNQLLISLLTRYSLLLTSNEQFAVQSYIQGFYKLILNNVQHVDVKFNISDFNELDFMNQIYYMNRAVQILQDNNYQISFKVIITPVFPMLETTSTTVMMQTLETIYLIKYMSNYITNLWTFGSDNSYNLYSSNKNSIIFTSSTQSATNIINLTEAISGSFTFSCVIGSLPNGAAYTINVYGGTNITPIISSTNNTTGLIQLFTKYSYTNINTFKIEISVSGLTTGTIEFSSIRLFNTLPSPYNSYDFSTITNNVLQLQNDIIDSVIDNISGFELISCGPSNNSYTTNPTNNITFNSWDSNRMTVPTNVLPIPITTKTTFTNIKLVFECTIQSNNDINYFSFIIRINTDDNITKRIIGTIASQMDKKYIIFEYAPENIITTNSLQIKIQAVYNGKTNFDTKTIINLNRGTYILTSSLKINCNFSDILNGVNTLSDKYGNTLKYSLDATNFDWTILNDTTTQIYSTFFSNIKTITNAFNLDKYENIKSKILSSKICIQTYPVFNEAFSLILNTMEDASYNLYNQGIPLTISCVYSTIFGYNSIITDFSRPLIGRQLDLIDIKTLVYNSVKYCSLSDGDIQSLLSNLDLNWSNWINLLWAFPSVCVRVPKSKPSPDSSSSSSVISNNNYRLWKNLLTGNDKSMLLNNVTNDNLANIVSVNDVKNTQIIVNYTTQLVNFVGVDNISGIFNFLKNRYNPGNRLQPRSLDNTLQILNYFQPIGFISEIDAKNITVNNCTIYGTNCGPPIPPTPPTPPTSSTTNFTANNTIKMRKISLVKRAYNSSKTIVMKNYTKRTTLKLKNVLQNIINYGGYTYILSLNYNYNNGGYKIIKINTNTGNVLNIGGYSLGFMVYDGKLYTKNTSNKWFYDQNNSWNPVYNMSLEADSVKIVVPTDKIIDILRTNNYVYFLCDDLQNNIGGKTIVKMDNTGKKINIGGRGIGYILYDNNVYVINSQKKWYLDYNNAWTSNINKNIITILNCVYNSKIIINLQKATTTTRLPTTTQIPTTTRLPTPAPIITNYILNKNDFNNAYGGYPIIKIISNINQNIGGRGIGFVLYNNIVYVKNTANEWWYFTNKWNKEISTGLINILNSYKMQDTITLK